MLITTHEGRERQFDPSFSRTSAINKIKKRPAAPTAGAKGISPHPFQGISKDVPGHL